ncbi:MAG: CysZ protein [Flavobacteriales bacterium]|jgi:CysZ protein
MIKGILNGLKTYRSSFGLIGKLGLWKYFAVPIFISVLTATVIIFSALSFSDNLGTWASKLWPWEWGAETFSTIAEVFGVIFILALGLIVYKHTIMALSAPFMSPVSEKIEAHLKGGTYTPSENTFGAQLWRGIRINGRNLGMELLLTIPILILGLIPIIGIISTALLFLVQAYYAGFGNMDYTLERHYTYGESVNFVQKNRGQAIGNGIVFMLFLLIPFIGVILALPLAVTAATAQTCGLLDNKPVITKP